MAEINPMVPVSAIRAIAVEAIRAVTGCPDVSNNGKHLTDELESVAQAAAESLRTTSQTVGVPEGWSIERGSDGSSIKLRGPSEDYSRFHDDGEHERNGLVWALLNAMLTASPTPPAAQADALITVDMVPPATARDRWMFEQGRLAERDQRTHAIEATAWAHPDGRVVPAATMDAARRDGGAMASSLAGYTIALGPIATPTAAGDEAKVTIKVKRKLFSFTSQQDWVNKANSRYTNCGVPKGQYIAVDALGHVMHMGKCFMAATELKAYPVTCYELETNWAKAEAGKVGG